MASGSWKSLCTTFTRKEVSMNSEISFWEGESCSYSLAHCAPSSKASSCEEREFRACFARYRELTNLPGHETDCFDNGRLHDFFSREYTPCYGIRAIRVGVRSQVTAPIDHVVRDVAISLNLRD